jgi:hypothetical protein
VSRLASSSDFSGADFSPTRLTFFAGGSRRSWESDREVASTGTAMGRGAGAVAMRALDRNRPSESCRRAVATS